VPIANMEIIEDAFCTFAATISPWLVFSTNHQLLYKIIHFLQTENNYTLIPNSDNVTPYSTGLLPQRRPEKAQ